MQDTTQCRLVRYYDTPDQHYRIQIARGLGFAGQNWTVQGNNVPAYSSPTSVQIGLAQPATTHRIKTNPYLIKRDDAQGFGWNDPDGFLLGALRDGQLISFKGPKKLNVTLEPTDARSAIMALEACEYDLFAAWGYDANQLRNLSAHVAPSNYPGRWVTIDDYPPADLASKNEGITTFLLDVGEDGSAKNCRIVESSGFPSLDIMTCQAVLSRATFQPARDAKGQSVPSFYANMIRWSLPR